MYLFIPLFTLLLAPYARALLSQSHPSTSRSNMTAVSPDGYRYHIEDEPYVKQTFKHEDGTTSEVWVHPQLARPEARQKGLNNSVSRLDWIGTHQDSDMCGPATFEKRTTRGSPSVADCLKIRDWYRNHDGGYFSAVLLFDLRISGDWTKLVIWDSCTIGVRGKGTVCGLKIGNTDISDLVGDAIDKFQVDGLVGAEGEMMCQTSCQGDYKEPTLWAVFHA